MRICILGAGGFIGHHLLRHLRGLGHQVRGVDIKAPEFSPIESDFEILDLREQGAAVEAIAGFDRVYHLAADMGGIGWISTHHAEILSNSLQIDLNVLRAARDLHIPRLLFTSSACVYPEYNQLTPDAAGLKESEVYPAQPEAAYGWGKLTTEKLCQHFREDYGLETRISRFHNVYGPEETWEGGREKAPAAISRKIAYAKMTGQSEIEIWGDGLQRRSFIYVTDVVKALVALMESDYNGAVNIGNDYTVSVNELTEMLAKIAGWIGTIKHVSGHLGVRGRNSDNTLAKEIIKITPQVGLEEGLTNTYNWIEQQVLSRVPTEVK